MSAKALSKNGAPSSELRTVIICEDLESGKQAKELEDHLFLTLNSRIRFVPEAWTFGALQHPQLQDLAARQINQADIILFSIRGEAGLPAGIKSWLENHLAPADRPRALVALFGHPISAKQLHSTRLYLEQIAANRSLDFFAHAHEGDLKREQAVLADAL